MISFLKGIIVEKYPTRILVDVNGVGYELNVTLNCSNQIGTIGQTVTVLTILHAKEDSVRLYGFCSNDERELFTFLISTPGIGPKKALAILSGTTVDDLQRYILEENISALTSLSGVGRKTAQRLIVDLKEKLSAVTSLKTISYTDKSQTERKTVEEAVLALLSLGYKYDNAEKTVQSILAETSEDIALEELIKKALSKI